METTKIPDGYRADAKGRLVPETQIKPIDLERDELLAEILAAAMEINARLRDFRLRTFADVDAFAALSAERYGAKLGGRKGNLSLVSFDGSIRLDRAMADQLVFDERLQAAKSLIDECLKEWAEGSRAEIVTLIGDAFQVDRTGKIDTARILSLRKLDIKDARWERAMEAIGDSLQVSSTRSYIRIYQRDPATGNYEKINLDLANA